MFTSPTIFHEDEMKRTVNLSSEIASHFLFSKHNIGVLRSFKLINKQRVSNVFRFTEDISENAINTVFHYSEMYLPNSVLLNSSDVFWEFNG